MTSQNIMYDNISKNGNNSATSATNFAVDEIIIEAADAIIGGLILDKAAITWMYDILDLQYFPLRRQKLVAQVIKDLHQRSLVPDLMTVTMELDRRGQLEQAGGKQYLAAVLEKTVSAVNIDQYFFLLVEAVDNYSPDGTIRPAVALELVKEYWVSDRSEEQLALDLEDLRERVGMASYKWEKFIAATVRKCRKVRYKLELKRLLVIGDELERSVEIDEVCEIYRKGRRTVERDLARMEAKTLKPDNNTFSLMEFLQQETQAIDWIYPGIVPKGELLLLTAQAKCGKTLWATDLMYAVVSGTPLHNNEIPKGRVLYIYSDEPSSRSVIRRLRNRGFDLLMNSQNMQLMSSLDLNDLSTLETQLEDFRPTLVVIDSLTSISTNLSTSEKDPEFARHVYKLGKLLGKYNAAGVLIHHENKNSEQKGIEKVSGTARLTAAVWGIAQMKAAQPDNPKCTERWLSVTPREGSPETYLFDLNPKEIWSEKGIFSFSGELGDESGQKRTQGDRVLALLKKYPGKGLEYLEIDSYLNIGRSLYTVLDRLEDRKLITRRRSTINPRRWVYLIEGTGVEISANPHQTLPIYQSPPELGDLGGRNYESEEARVTEDQTSQKSEVRSQNVGVARPEDLCQLPFAERCVSSIANSLPNTTDCKDNVTQNFSLPDPSLSQQVVELNSENIDRQELEVSQQLVNQSVNNVNSLVNHSNVEDPSVELDNPEPEEDTDVSQQNPLLNNAPKKNVVQIKDGDTDTTPVEVDIISGSIEPIVTQSNSDEDSDHSGLDTAQTNNTDGLNEDEIKVGDRVKILAGGAASRQGTVEAINQERVLAPYCIRLSDDYTTDEPLFNFKRI